MKKAITTVTILFSIIFGVLGFIVSMTHFSYSIESKSEFHIKNEADFYHYTTHYTAYDVCYLSGNIEVSQLFDSIGNKKDIFQSTFDGKGYSIEFKDNAQSKSLFDIIGEQGVVKNLEIKIDKCTINQPSYGALAIQNYGKISNVMVEIEELSIYEETIAGGIVGLNYGEMSFLYGNIKVINNKGVSTVGTLCGYNDGKISNAFSIISYSNVPEVIKENLLNGAVNNSYGFACGVNNKADGIVECYYMNKDSYLCSDRYITKNLSNYLSDFEFDVVLSILRFPVKIWKLTIDDTNEINFEFSIKDGVVSE